jgi:hypothetical protein
MFLAVGGANTSGAQWFNYPSPRAPRTSTGEVNLSAPAPQLTNGKPDLSGVWMTANLPVSSAVPRL